jgi:hypothetical protein
LYKEIHDLQLVQREEDAEGVKPIFGEKPMHENTIMAGRSNSG